MVSIDIDDRGFATLAIADAGGEVHQYRFEFVHPGLALFAVKLLRTDTEATYLVRELSPGRWACNCPAETYRKRGADHCKHCGAGRSLRDLLRAMTPALKFASATNQPTAPAQTA